MTGVTLRPFLRLHKQMMMALIMALLLAACGGDEPATPTSEATPAAGGMVMPTVAGDASQTATATVAAATAPTVAVAALFIGDAVEVLPEQEFRLYMDATGSAMVMNIYAPGERFTVLDPSGDYAIYPVERDGGLWYRLRAPDGLVGWGAADQIAPVN